MILSNVELFRALDEGRVVIDPEPVPRDPRLGKSPFSTSSVDLRLDSELSVPKSAPVAVDPASPGGIREFLLAYSERRTIRDDQPYELKPGSFILAQTLETITLPLPTSGKTCLAADIEGRSTLGRLGISVHITAPTIHPGFSGKITLEMVNVGKYSVLLKPGMAIAQLIVHEVKGIPFSNPSQFPGQTTPEGLNPTSRTPN